MLSSGCGINIPTQSARTSLASTCSTARSTPRRESFELKGSWGVNRKHQHGLLGYVLSIAPILWSYPQRFYLKQQFFGGSEDAFVREISFVDPATQQATITSVNLSLSQFATCYEQIRYTPSSGSRTNFVQTAEIQARMALWRSAADGLEKWLVQRFEHNAALGKMGFTDVLRTMWEERHPNHAHAGATPM